MEGESKIITEEARELLRIGDVCGRTTHKVTDLWVQEYAIALRDGNPLWLDNEYAEREGWFGYRVAPSAFFTVLNPTERGEIQWGREYFQKLREQSGRRSSGAFAAFSNVEYLDTPIRVGDTIACEASVADTYEKSGENAVLVFVEVDYVMTNQEGKKVGRATAGWITSFPHEG
jgi:acyl dehydratase